MLTTGSMRAVDEGASEGRTNAMHAEREETRATNECGYHDFAFVGFVFVGDSGGFGILGFSDFGIFGFWDLGIWGFEDFGIFRFFGFGDFGIWGFACIRGISQGQLGERP